MQYGDFRRLLSEVNRDGQEVQICRFKAAAWDPNAGTKRPKLEDRDPFPAKVLNKPPAGIALPPTCDIVTEIYPRRVGPEANDAAVKLSDLVTSDGKS